MSRSFLKVKVDSTRLDAVFQAMARKPISDRPAFREIAERLHDAILRQMTMAQPVNSEATQERKEWGPIRRSGTHGATGSGTGVLFSSGNSRANLEERSTDVSAAVKRGKGEWWLFLHDRGKGYAYWSQEGRRTKGLEARKKRANAGNRGEARTFERAGATPFPEREFMSISAADQGWALERVQKAVEDSILNAMERNEE